MTKGQALQSAPQGDSIQALVQRNSRSQACKLSGNVSLFHVLEGLGKNHILDGLEVPP